jgi:WAX2 C-terminal domain/Fatty acid hydroxylase superfamily
MASHPGFGTQFPWESLGNFKYLLFVPFAAVVATGNDDADHWCFHMLVIVALRYVVAQVMISLSRIHALTERTKIQDKGISYEQIDREDNWDDFIIMQAIVMTMVHCLPYLGYNHFPLVNTTGLWYLLAFHAGPAEFLYYWLHRALHDSFLFQRYHSHHHKSFVTEPITGSVHPFMEHVMYTAIFAIPLLGPWALGQASIAMFYTYLLAFDFLNMMGHCNYEFIPEFIMKIPGFKYLIYTPSYHSLHHSRVHTNFCLFMPIYDHLYGTVDKSSDVLYERAIRGESAPKIAPDVVFMGHGTHLVSLFHLPCCLRSFSSRPFRNHSLLNILWPVAALAMIPMRFFGRPFCHDKHRLHHLRLETWVTPAWGFQFFFSSFHSFINSKIEQAILEADQMGVKVLGLGALNKNEALNGGGSLFVERHPDLTVRVVHGNTLTAAAVLQKIPTVDTVFLTGSTSKLGRAIALYLSDFRNTKVIMYTTAKDRFEKIQKEAKVPSNLIYSPTMEPGKSCNVWIVGKFCSPKEQALAPPGTTFHQFVVPPLEESRKDCVYTDLPAFRLPKAAKDFKTCEMTMERGDVHACHAGAIVHGLEKWDHHEVGAIDHSRIDDTWEASLKHGFTLK